MKIIIISEENHGTIGAAISIKEAVKWLIESEWLTAYDDCDGKYNEQLDRWEYSSPCARYGENWKEILPNRPEKEIEYFLDGSFLFHEEFLHGAE